MTGAILDFVCLVLVFDLRVATWIPVGIPPSFIGLLLFFSPAGLTVNMGTVFGFFLMFGVVVDHAVVVAESIAAERERGMGRCAPRYPAYGRWRARSPMACARRFWDFSPSASSPPPTARSSACLPKSRS